MDQSQVFNPKRSGQFLGHSAFSQSLIWRHWSHWIWEAVLLKKPLSYPNNILDVKSFDVWSFSLHKLLNRDQMTWVDVLLVLGEKICSLARQEADIATKTKTLIFSVGFTSSILVPEADNSPLKNFFQSRFGRDSHHFRSPSSSLLKSSWAVSWMNGSKGLLSAWWVLSLKRP